MRTRKFRTFIGDFETTVYKNQQHTEVWASASVELHTEDVQIFHSIGEQFEYFSKMKENVLVYYHNLKFDGTFWLSYLLLDLKLEQAYLPLNDDESDVEWLEEKYMKNNTFKYSISDMGQWYSIIIKVNNKIIEIRDSLKLLPFSVEEIGKSFKTKHQKLTMEYTGCRYAGCEISAEEKEYIANDVLVVKEAIEIMYQEGHDKITIGSCCLSEYKDIMGKDDYEHLFPDITQFKIDKQDYGYSNADEYIRRSYKGGWCYLVKEKANKLFYDGITADVNSLYPSMMSSESGNRYPTGKPIFWKGNYIPELALKDTMYYFVRIRTKFKLKKGYLPFLQIKGSHLYKGTEALETSDVYDEKTNKYYDKYIDERGIIRDTAVELVLTMTDFQLLKEHYDLYDFTILDGCYFYTVVGLFDNYIEKYKRIKQNSTGAIRMIAKLFLNNLYGKMASSTNSSFKVAYLKPDGVIGFIGVVANEKQAGFIPVGSAITSYARNFTIRTAQKNYYGPNKAGFIYADTDSIHCDLKPEELKNVNVHESNFCCWKLEASWDTAIFTRQKTYIEHVTKEDLKPVNPYYNVKCAGMPKRCKDLFVKSMQGYIPLPEDKYSEEAIEFIQTKRTLEDFKIGLLVPGKLMPKRIRGGTLLVETSYEMR